MSECFATPWAVVRQTPLSMGFPRQEYWSEMPFPISLLHTNQLDLSPQMSNRPAKHALFRAEHLIFSVSVKYPSLPATLYISVNVSAYAAVFESEGQRQEDGSQA